MYIRGQELGERILIRLGSEEWCLGKSKSGGASWKINRTLPEDNGTFQARERACKEAKCVKCYGIW